MRLLVRRERKEKANCGFFITEKHTIPRMYVDYAGNDIMEVSEISV